MRPARCLLFVLLTSSGLHAADDAPLSFIDRGNASAHAGLLTPGQQALIEAMPDSFRMPVHAASGTPAPVAALIAGTRSDAVKPRLDDDGRLVGYSGGLPFPEIDSTDLDGGLKAIWNHRLRWRGAGRERATVDVVIGADGELNLVEMREHSRFPRGLEPGKAQRPPLLAQQIFAIAAPKRLAGTLKLLHEDLNGALRAWQRSPGPVLPSVKETTEAGDDTPVVGADGLYNEDQREGFSGNPERWRWKRVSMSERLMPWAADRFHARDRTPATLLGPRHPDITLLRYEPRRVIRIDASLKPDRSSPWPRRSYYLDAATWQVLLVELYDRDDRLQRVQEIHLRAVGDLLLPAAEVIYDLPGRRYRLGGLETQVDATSLIAPPAEDFLPARAARWAKSVGAGPPRR